MKVNMNNVYGAKHSTEAKKCKKIKLMNIIHMDINGEYIGMTEETNWLARRASGRRLRLLKVFTKHSHARS